MCQPRPLSEVRVNVGDVIVVGKQRRCTKQARAKGSTFEHRFRNNDAFSLITVMPESSPPKRLQMQAAMFLKAVMVGTQIVDSALDNEGLIDIFTAAFLTASLMLLTRYLRDDQAQNNINCKNLEKAGLSQAIANTFIKISRGINTKRAPYVAIYIRHRKLTIVLLSELVSNNAAAAIMYPIAAGQEDALNIVSTQMRVVVMLSVSATFILPCGYQPI
uniref:Uncharacterized protein n=1 Tax=Physcomitrium patens TaxID=3218 RepID=A0A2K1J800_PHYPA|nr:hypothetical protein PHYPA_020762 [Physcomitrium patens]